MCYTKACPRSVQDLYTVLIDLFYDTQRAQRDITAVIKKTLRFSSKAITEGGYNTQAWKKKPPPFQTAA